MKTANGSDRSFRSFYDTLPPDAFSRADESRDPYFYARDRFVQHLDATALETVETLISRLIVEEHARILDLMASWDSHISEAVRPAAVVGLGLNASELARNEILTEALLHDLNEDPSLPFPDETVDVVLNTVSVDYMTRPAEVFAEVARVLKPNGLFLVIFSNRMFPEKATRIWRESSEEERVALVEALFASVPRFEPPKRFVSAGKPRPRDDKYAPLGIPSDPVYAVYADKAGPAEGEKARPAIGSQPETSVSAQELSERMKAIRHTLACSYCGRRMNK